MKNVAPPPGKEPNPSLYKGPDDQNDFGTKLTWEKWNFERDLDDPERRARSVRNTRPNVNNSSTGKRGSTTVAYVTGDSVLVRVRHRESGFSARDQQVRNGPVTIYLRRLLLPVGNGIRPASVPGPEIAVAIAVFTRLGVGGREYGT